MANKEATARIKIDRSARIIAPLETRPTSPIQSMINATKKPGGWSGVRQQLATWEEAGGRPQIKKYWG